MIPPKEIKFISDGNELSFIEIKKDKTYLYKYTKSLTKLGMTVSFTEKDLDKFVKLNKK